MKLDLLTLFGLLAVSLMLIFYTLEHRSRRYTLAFAFACGMGSAYGFMQGAWPFGIIEAIWALIALNKWRQAEEFFNTDEDEGERPARER